MEKFEIQKVFVKLLGLDVKPARIAYTYDAEHLINIHKYLFGDIYEWAGEQYKIAKADYEAFREKYSIKKD